MLPREGGGGGGGEGEGEGCEDIFCGGGPYGLQGDGGWMNRGQQDVMVGGGGGY